MDVDTRLSEIRKKLENGIVPFPITVRELLSWFRAQRRGSNVTWRIRSAFEKYELDTQPNYETAYIDSQVRFKLATEVTSEGDSVEMYRVDSLESANNPPLTIAPTHSVARAASLMIAHDYSQLPVITSPREIKGVVSWKTIGRCRALNVACEEVRDCMEDPRIIASTASLFKAIKIVADHEYVCVQAQNKTLTGIVTASDLSTQFKDLAEPFLLISEIETTVRKMISGKYTVDELNQAKDPKDDGRVVLGVADLSFGEYVSLLENPEMWKKLNLTVDQSVFVGMLAEARKIRNDIMHFDPQGLEPDSISHLKTLLRLLKKMKGIGIIPI